MAGQALVAFFLCLLSYSELMPSNTHLPNATRSDTTYGLDATEGSMSQLAQKSASACTAFFYKRVNLPLGRVSVFYFHLQFNAAPQIADSASHTGMCQKLFVRCHLPSTPSLIEALCRMRITRSRVHAGFLQLAKEILWSRRLSSRATVYVHRPNKRNKPNTVQESSKKILMPTIYTSNFVPL